MVISQSAWVLVAYIIVVVVGTVVDIVVVVVVDIVVVVVGSDTEQDPIFEHFLADLSSLDYMCQNTGCSASENLFLQPVAQLQHSAWKKEAHQKSHN